MHVHDKIVEQVNAIPVFGDEKRGNPAGWYRCFRREHLQGFTPLACFGHFTKPREFVNEENSKIWKKQRRYNTDVGFFEMWMLMEKHGTLYIDHLQGIEPRYFYGFLPNPPLARDVLLPAPVFDSFRDFVGAESWRDAFLDEHV